MQIKHLFFASCIYFAYSQPVADVTINFHSSKFQIQEVFEVWNRLQVISV